MNIKSREPVFILIAAVSLDGRITVGEKEGSEWTSKEDKKFFQAEMDRADAVVMGHKTFDAIKRPLKPRNRIVFSRSPLVKGVPDAERAGVVVFVGPPKKLLTLLQERSWHRITIVGGTQIYDWFLKHSLVDEIYLTLEPVVFGSGRPLFSQNLRNLSPYRLTSIKKLNKQGTLLLHCKVKK